MKKLMICAMAVLALAACKKDNSEESSSQNGATATIVLDKNTATVEVGQYLQLVATVTPAGTAVTWSSNHTDIAIVDANGLVQGVANGSAIITATVPGGASAACLIAVTKPGEEKEGDMAKYLTGDNYYIFSMDDITIAKLGNKVKGDFRLNGSYEADGSIPDEATSVLEIWGNSMSGGEGGGLNAFGEGEGYISLVSQTGEGWGLGCGAIRQIHRTVDLTGVTEDYTLVIMYKTPANNKTDKKGVKFTLYSTVAGGAEVGKEVSSNTNGEWVALEYPMSDFFNQKLKWDKPYVWSADADAFYTVGLLVNGLDQGLDLDAVFVYQKAAE